MIVGVSRRMENLIPNPKFFCPVLLCKVKEVRACSDCFRMYILLEKRMLTDQRQRYKRRELPDYTETG